MKGLNEISFIQAEDILDKKNIFGMNIAVIGGSRVGCEVAEFMALDGKRVMLFEMMEEIAEDMEARSKKLLMKRLSELNVDIIANAKIDAIQKKKIFFERGNVRNQVDDIDTIVVAVGYQAAKMKRATEKGQSLQVFNIGSMVTAKNALETIHSGFHLGISI